MDKNEMTITHKWQEAGIGRAPFKVITIIAVPGTPDMSSGTFGAVDVYNAEMREAGQRAKKYGVHLCTCEACGMSLMNNVVIRDADGKHFVVGLDCAEKTDDAEVISNVKLCERNRQKAKRAAKREAAYKAACAKREAEENEREASRKANEALVNVLEGASRYPDDFAASIVRSILDGNDINERGRSIACEIYGKQFGRRGSKKFEAAWNEAEELFAKWEESK